MSTTPSWSFDRPSLERVLDKWHGTNPTTQHKSYVNEFLMDLLTLGPFEVGEWDDETESFSGIAGNVVGSMIVMTWTADLDALKIFPTAIQLTG